MIIGGGYIGLEAAAVCAKLGLDVTVLEAAPRILGRVAAAETADVIRDLHVGNGVTVREGCQVAHLRGADGHVTGVTLASGETLEAEVVIVGIGIAPETALAEAAGIAVVYSIPVAIYSYRGLTWKTLARTIQESGITVGVVMIMIFMVLIVSDNLISQGAQRLAKELDYSVSDNPIVILLIINLVMILIGMLMDDISGLLLATPILLQIAQSTGMDPIHFAAVIGVNLGMANITPPTAPLLYLGAQVCDEPVSRMLWPTLIFIIFAWLPTLMLTTFVPELALFLPELLLG